MNINAVAYKLEEALKGKLPGTDVQWEMASSDRMISKYPRKKKKDSRLAAVLIVLYPVNNMIHTLFIQRPLYMGVHSGQISFPGGKKEDSDNNLTDTALREACEETGICGSDISVIGKLTPLYIPVSDIEVTPVVAYTKTRPDINSVSEEVVSLIEAELSIFFNPQIIKEKSMMVRGEKLKVKYFDCRGHIIWGATAMMLYELLVIIEENNINFEQAG
jgi:8-oxo-dGTP pyrophosphatase MutT (NUDIX family)